MTKFMTLRSGLAAGVLGLAGAATLGLAGTATGEKAMMTDGGASVFVIDFTADWCPRCQGLKKNIDSIDDEFKTEGVLFLRADLTDDASKAQTGYLMAELGLSDVWKQSGNQRSYMAIVDADTNSVIAKHGHRTSSGDLKTAIRSAL